MLPLFRLEYTTLEDLANTKGQAGVVFLLRHAERHPLNAREDVITAGLTERGRRDAFEFGRRLSATWKIGTVFSSPIQRCVHTGEGILQGAGIAAAIQLKWWLYSPNLRSATGREAVGSSVRLLADQYLMELDKRKIRLALQRMKFPAGQADINLYIAHDTTVLPVLAYLLGLDEVAATQVPGYLEGIVLTRRDGVVALAG